MKRAVEINRAADAKRAEDAKVAQEAKKTAVDTNRAAEAKAAIHAAQAAEVKRAAAAKAALDAAVAAETKRQQATSAAEARKAATAAKALENKQRADARIAAKTTTKAPAGPQSAAPPADRSPNGGAATCSAAGTDVSPPGWYVVQKGDTLSGIAKRHYGTARDYRRIRAANRRQIRNPNRIYACQRIYLPRMARRG